MNTATFWRLIERTKTESEGDCERQGELLTQYLWQLPIEEIVSFYHLFEDHLRVAKSYELWDAASLIKGFCSQDGFLYFRSWLIGQGETVFQRAVSDPDSLADVVEFHPMFTDPYDCEGLMYVAWQAYTLKTDQEPPLDAEEWQRPAIASTSPRGTSCKEGEHPRAFPKLWAIFGHRQE